MSLPFISTLSRFMYFEVELERQENEKSLIAWGMINFISYLHSIIYFFFALSLPPIFVDFMDTLQFIYQRESKS